MAEELVEPRRLNLRQWLPWTELFNGFRVALDPKKLLMAAAGILAMACWWWLWSVVFYSSRAKPEWPKDYPTSNYRSDGENEAAATDKAWRVFKSDRAKWNLLYETAGAPGPDGRPEDTDAGDLADNPQEFDVLKRQIDQKERAVTPKPYGTLRTWPFFEDRGPNPYFLVTGQARFANAGEFFYWLVYTEIPVLVEPLVKFLRPVLYLFRATVGFWNYVYLGIVILGTLAIWALFGGAITRMAAVQIARKEKIGMGEALRFTLARWVSFFSAPLFPLLFILVLVVLAIVFGLFHLIPVFGDVVVDGLGWPLILLAGLVMAVVLVGLVGWPMMYATISAEGSDSFDALSRSYSYVYQSPWHYLWYTLVALAYGMVVVFFVGFMGSLIVYLGEWAVRQTPFAKKVDRDPAFLFVYAPTSYGWRDLLLQGTDAEVNGVVSEKALHSYVGTFQPYNKWGAFLVAVWVYLFFLMILGFAYSYFWTAGTIIYLLMRRDVDDTEVDEVYLEEDEAESAYSAPVPEAPEPSPPGGPGLTMVEAPTLKTPAPASQPPPVVESGRVDQGDGNPPSGS
jgi:hypothetical protein